MPVDKSPARIRGMFGQIARRYDLLNHLLSLGIDRRWRRKTVRLVRPEGPWPVLDLCTGTGDLALEFGAARAGRRGGEGNEDSPPLVVGSDFCRPMLTEARRKVDRSGVAGQICLVEADSLRLPFADDSFQIVSVAFGLRNVGDTDRGLREMVRVCRPGGRVAVLEFSTPTLPPLRLVYGWYFRHVLPRVGQVLAKNRQAAYNYLPSSVGEFPQGEALAARMKLAGLGRVWHRRFTFGVVTLYVGVK